MFRLRLHPTRINRRRIAAEIESGHVEYLIQGKESGSKELQDDPRHSFFKSTGEAFRFAPDRNLERGLSWNQILITNLNDGEEAIPEYFF